MARRRTDSKALAAQAYEQKVDEIIFEDEPTREGGQFQDHLVLFYGPVKIGKSRMCSLFPGVYFLPTEPGYKALNVRKTYIKSWAAFIKFVKKTEKSPKFRKTVKIWCIDTVDNLAKFCMQYVCGREGISHPTDQDWGKGWEAFRDEFTHWILRLCGQGQGAIFISHQTERTVIHHGVKIPKEVPALPKTCYTVINNLVDIIFKMSWTGKTKRYKDTLSTKRCLFTKPTAIYDAGDRTDRLPDTITFKTEREAVDIILNSFDSKSKTKKRKKIKKHK